MKGQWKSTAVGEISWPASAAAAAAAGAGGSRLPVAPAAGDPVITDSGGGGLLCSKQGKLSLRGSTERSGCVATWGRVRSSRHERTGRLGAASMQTGRDSSGWPLCTTRSAIS